MLTYTWKINSLSKQDCLTSGLNDIVVQTHWERKGTDAQNNSGTYYGALSFNLNDIDPNNFIPYEELTEADVLGWVQTSINNRENYQAQIDIEIQKQIDLITHPITIVTAAELPWSEPTANT